MIRAYFKYLNLECVLDIEGRAVQIRSDDIVPENRHGGVLDAQIQDEMKIAIECKAPALPMEEQEEYETEFEARYFTLEDRPDWWHGLEYYKQNYGNDCAKEMYEGQTQVHRQISRLRFHANQVEFTPTFFPLQQLLTVQIRLLCHRGRCQNQRAVLRASS